MKRRRKNKSKLTPLGLIIIIILAVIGYFSSSYSDNGGSNAPQNVGLITSDNASGSSAEQIPEKGFKIFFLDVGQGDSAFIVCDGQTMLIDGGKSNKSNTLYSFLKRHDIKKLDYIVASHADSDHIGGLPGALNFAKADRALCTVSEHDTKVFQNFLKYLSVPITVPDAGDTFNLGSAKCTVLYPEKGESFSSNTSLVIRIEYGNTSFLFTGDAEYEDEKSILESGQALESTVLKVGHHGSNSSSCYSFINAVSPQYAVISVGSDNSYGHPADNVLSRFKDLGTCVLRTDMQGDIICTSDGSSVKFEVSRNADIDTYSYAGGYKGK